MSTLVHFKRKLNSLVLEQVKRQAASSWLSSQTMPTEIVDALVAKVERLQRELHDMTIRYDERVRMYNQAIAYAATWESPGRGVIDYPEPSQIHEEKTGNAGT